MKLTFGIIGVLAGAALFACGTKNPDSVFSRPGSTSSGSGSGSASTTSGSMATYTFTSGGLGSFSDDGGTTGSGDASTVVCDDAGKCTCSDGNTTTIEGTVYDPAGANPLYNIVVYVPDPASPLPDLESVAPGCGCSQLYPKSVLAESAPTDTSGHFVIPCAPSGNVSVVVQTGKWRMQFDNIAVTAGQKNTIQNLHLPTSTAQGSLPNLAIATGGADSLECLPFRIGVDPSEYTLGSATGGHVHIYTGFNGATMAAGSVAADQALWDQEAHLAEHDVVLLSCEGHETTGGNPGTPMNGPFQTSLMDYANTGGRVFASHYHYAWFDTGPFNTGANKLANWNIGAQQIDDTVSFPGDIDTTLASGNVFPEGSALHQWLGVVGALTGDQLPIWFARHNVQTLLQPPSTEWIHIDANASAAPNATQYFSVDTPIGASSEAICGRIVYSDLHVSGGPGMNAPGVPPDYADAGRGGAGGGGGGGGGGAVRGGIVPSGCATHSLTPQEEALEFMLFDLSSCLVPVGNTVPPSPPVVPK